MAKPSLKKVFFLVSALLILIVLLLLIGVWLFLVTPAEEEGMEQVVFVQEGLSLNEVANELEKRNIIVNKTLFGLWGKIMGSSRRIKAGEYRLSPNMPPIRILEILTAGAVITYPVTLPEGYTIEQIADERLPLDGHLIRLVVGAACAEPAARRQIADELATLAVGSKEGSQAIELGEGDVVAGILAAGFQVLRDQPECLIRVRPLVLNPDRVVVKVRSEVDLG